MKKPILLLDVDGVLAPWPSKLGFSEDTHYLAESGDVYIRRDLKNLIGKLDVIVELQWGTAWERQANVHMLEHLGLTKPLPFIEFHDYDDLGGMVETIEEEVESLMDHKPRVEAFHRWSGENAPDTWKLPWIERFCRNTDRSVIWIDDEIEQDGQAFAESRETPTLFVKTDGNIGLSEEHVEEIETWVASLDEVC